MPYILTPSQMWQQSLLALAIWRESRGQSIGAKRAVAWSIRNRVLRPTWWGHTWDSVILMPYQYSSFNRVDPNATKFPVISEPSFEDCLLVASQVYTPDPDTQPALVDDPTQGADSYFDHSLDSHPPGWSTDGSKAFTCDWDTIHFYRTLK